MCLICLIKSIESSDLLLGISVDKNTLKYKTKQTAPSLAVQWTVCKCILTPTLVFVSGLTSFREWLLDIFR